MSPPEAHHLNVSILPVLTALPRKDQTDHENMGSYENTSDIMETGEICIDPPGDIQGYSLPLAYQGNHPEPQGRARPLLQCYRIFGEAGGWRY